MKKALMIWLCVTLSVAAVIGMIFVCGEIGRRLRPIPQTVFDADEHEPEHILKIYTYANIPGESGETRSLRELTEPVYTGRLLRKTNIGEKYPSVIKPDTICYEADMEDDDIEFYEPVLIFEADGTIEAEYSCDIGIGWLRYGETLSKANEEVMARGNGRLKVSPNVSDATDETFGWCSDDMREYNAVEKYRLREIFPDFPASVDSELKYMKTRLFIRVYDKNDPEKLIAEAVILVEQFCGGVNEVALADAGFGSALTDRELSPYIKLSVESYSQINIAD